MTGQYSAGLVLYKIAQPYRVAWGKSKNFPGPFIWFL